MSSYNLSKSLDNSKTSKRRSEKKEAHNDIKQIVRRSKYNIDSRHRNYESKNILDNRVNQLSLNPITIINRNENESEMIIYHPNHDYDIGDNIVIQGIKSASINLSLGITFIANSSYAKIEHKNHGLDSSTTNDIHINITGFIGNTNNGTQYNNIPINKINGLHKVYFVRNDRDIENNNHYYIFMENVIANFSSVYDLTSINITFDNINGIKLNLLNANYPLSIDQVQGYHVINSVADDTYSVQLEINNNISIYEKGGDSVWTARVIEFIEGYSNNNYYKIPLKKTFNNVSRIKLISTEFPNTEKPIKSIPESKRNNMFRWKLEDDGDTIYSIELEPGNYSIELLEKSIFNAIESTFRDTIRIVNSNLTDYRYYDYHQCTVDIEPRTDTFSLEFYTTIFYPKALTYKRPSEYTDNTGRFIVTHPNHRLQVGSIITIVSATNTDSVPQEVINSTFNIEKIINENTYQIKLPLYNISTSNTDVTNGGDAMGIRFPIKSQLLFDSRDTIGPLIGFRNTGKSNAITNYSYKNTNKDVYQNDVVLNEDEYPNNSINLSGDSYITMITPIVKDSYNSGEKDNVFAKLLLSDEPGTVIYNQFVQLGEHFDPPIENLSSWEVGFFDPNDEPYDFGDINHSYTLEIHELLN